MTGAAPGGGAVVAVSVSRRHTFSKEPQDVVRLLEGLGVEGDAHAGRTVQHLSRIRRDPTRPNLRQVHLVQAELHDELRGRGYDLTPGAIGENVTTRGVPLLELPTGSRLRLGAEAVVELTGLRNPCVQLDRHRAGLMKAVLGRTADGSLVRKAGVMAIVVAGGEVRPGDPVGVTLPPGPPQPLQPV